MRSIRDGFVCLHLNPGRQHDESSKRGREQNKIVQEAEHPGTIQVTQPVACLDTNRLPSSTISSQRLKWPGPACSLYDLGADSN